MKTIKGLFSSNAARFVLKLGISMALLLAIFNFIGAGKIYDELMNASPYYLVLAAAFVPIQILFKAARWSSIINIFKSKISLKASYAYTLISQSFGIITPGRVGELVKAKFLVDDTGMGYGRSIFTIIIDKAFDVIAGALIALGGLAFIWPKSHAKAFFAAAFIAYLLLMLFSLLFFSKIKKQILRLILKLLPKKYKANFDGLIMPRMLYAKSLAYSMLILIALSVQGFFVSKALYMDISFFVMLTLIPLMALSSSLPISIGGVGIREIVSISFLSSIGIPAEKSAVLSLLYTFITFGIPAIIGAILFFRRKKSTNQQKHRP